MPINYKFNKDNDFLVDSRFLQGEDIAFYNRISADMDSADMENSLGQLSRYLCKYYNKKVIILLDEYERLCRKLM